MLGNKWDRRHLHRFNRDLWHRWWICRLIGPGEFLGQHHQSNAAIFSFAIGGAVVGNGMKLTIADRAKALRIGSGFLSEEANRGGGSGCGKLPVTCELALGRDADRHVVGVPNDMNLALGKL